ncbi:MAG TPA: hypothetical protein VH723_04505, partial [Candidatus Limnocylindrales bacterium]
MPEPSRRLAAVATLIVVAVAVGIAQPLPATAADPDGLHRFREAIGQVESGGRYDARNPSSGARGKYQIMPVNWRPWAKRYLGIERAAWSPRNQDAVATGKMRDLHRWLGSWRRVAYWWLTGKSNANEATWSAYAKRYVARVMREYQAMAQPEISTRSYQEHHSSITWTGAWREAPYQAYAGRNARWTNEAGATATFTFAGSSVAWWGPSGPTRGRAKVLVDGAEVATVDLYARHFEPRTRIFS